MAELRRQNRLSCGREVARAALIITVRHVLLLCSLLLQLSKNSKNGMQLFINNGQ